MLKTLRNVFIFSVSINAFAADVSFLPHVIGANDINQPRSITIADINGDSYPDIVAASLNNKKIIYYLNDGSAIPSFSSHEVTTSPLAYKKVRCADFDADGDQDILTTGDRFEEYYEHLISYVYCYENNGDNPPAFSPHLIYLSIDGMITDVSAPDLNGDGHPDVLLGESIKGQIYWFENSGTPEPTFFFHTFSGMGVWYPETIGAADLNKDGALDVIGPQTSSTLAWYQNNKANPPEFISRPAGNLSRVTALGAADMNQDGKTDILQISGQYLVWLKNLGGVIPTFQTITITSALVGANCVVPADLNGDRKMDIVYTDLKNNVVAWYENSGGASPSFTQHLIDQDPNAFNHGIYEFCVADLDRDGDLDIIAASSPNNEIIWYENRLMHPNNVQKWSDFK